MSVMRLRNLVLRTGLVVLTLGLLTPSDSNAEWPRARKRPTRVVVTTSSPRVAGLAPSPMLGTFYPDPSPVNIRGNFEAGGGYSPLGTFGDTSATMYGPLSAFRTSAAPVLMYERGYDGNYRPSLGTGFSTPNFPAASPVVYPTSRNARNASHRMTTPPQWDSGINWLDLD